MRAPEHQTTAWVMLALAMLVWLVHAVRDLARAASGAKKR
jgi:hypothetical protein